MRSACTSVTGLEVHSYSVVGKCCGSSSLASVGGPPFVGSAPRPAVSPVGLPHQLGTGPRDDVTLPKGHRGVRTPSWGAAMAGFSCGRDPAAMTRPGVCSGVEYGCHTSTWSMVRRKSTSRAHTRRGSVRTNGHPIARGGTGVTSGRSSLVHRNDVAQHGWPAGVTSPFSLQSLSYMPPPHGNGSVTRSGMGGDNRVP